MKLVQCPTIEFSIPEFLKLNARRKKSPIPPLATTLTSGTHSPAQTDRARHAPCPVAYRAISLVYPNSVHLFNDLSDVALGPCRPSVGLMIEKHPKLIGAMTCHVQVLPTWAFEPEAGARALYFAVYAVRGATGEQARMLAGITGVIGRKPDLLITPA